MEKVDSVVEDVRSGTFSNVTNGGKHKLSRKYQYKAGRGTGLVHPKRMHEFITVPKLIESNFKETMQRINR